MKNRRFLSRAVIASCFLLLAIHLVTTVAAYDSDCTHCTPGPNNGSVANAHISVLQRKRSHNRLSLLPGLSRAEH